VQQWVPDIEAHADAPEGKLLTVNLKADSTNAVQELTFWDCGPFSERDAIICRNTKPLVELAYQFLRKRLPCMIEGRDIGQGLINLATRWRSCKTLIDLELKLSDWADKEVAKFKQMKQDYKAEAIQDQADTLLCLIDAAKSEGGEDINSVVTLIQRMFGDTPEGAKPKCVILSTVHKSKGREWPRVFLLGRNRYMPSKYATQPWMKSQETNLMYVAATRAMQELIEVNVPLK
jgi:superfamily I DNA/RNA helicase